MSGLLLAALSAGNWRLRADETVSQSGKTEVSNPQNDSSNAKKTQKETGTSEQTNLLKDGLEKQWEHFSSKNGVALGDVWKIEGDGDNRVLKCVGDPKGFLYSREAFANFELSFEWKYQDDPAGNSGILVFTQKEPRLWPTSMQIQLHQPSAGAVFPSGDATSDNSTDPTGDGLALDVGKWNTCHIIGRNGRLQVKINDRTAGEVSGCKPASGRIAIQSEGSETHFRKMMIRKLPPVQTAGLSEPSSTKPAAAKN